MRKYPEDWSLERIADDQAGDGIGFVVMLCLAAVALAAIAMEARQGTGPQGLDGEAATARAGTASPKGAHP